LKLPLAIAFSGGTAKSVAHIGVLKALEEEGIEPVAVAGTSGGGIVAALYASGMPVSSMEELGRHMSWRKLLSIKLSRLGFISSSGIEDFIREHIGDLTFAELKKPCFIVATDLETGAKRVFDSGSVARAVRASSSIPQIFLPVEIEGHYYIDGGFSEYLPVDTLQERLRVFAVGSHLAPVVSIYRRPRHVLQLIMQLTGIMARKNYLISEKKADFLIHPDLDRYSAFDFDHAAEMMEIAYETTRRSLPSLLAAWKRAGTLRGRIARWRRLRRFAYCRF